MKKILVTGASGYLGAKITVLLQKQGFEVVAFCRALPKNAKNIFQNIELIEADLTAQNSFEKLNAFDFEAVVHTVSLDHQLSEILPLEKVNEINVLTTWRLAEWALEKNISKFIYLSTIQVLGKLDFEKVDEKSTPFPQNRYGLSHYLCEDILESLNTKKRTHFISLRLSNGYGSPVFFENKCWSLVINNLCQMAFQEKKIVLLSDGSPLRDFIHVDDIAAAVLHFIQLEKAQNLYHISSANTLNILELALKVQSIFEQVYEQKIPIYAKNNLLVPKKLENYPKYQLDNSLLLASNFVPKIDLESGIKEIFTYLENNL